jgi:hypothetical protein
MEKVFNFVSLCILCRICQVYSIKIQSIPPQGSPPMSLSYTSGVFDPSTSTIYVVGGFNLQKNADTAEIFAYSLISNTWSEVTPASQFVPNGIEQHYCYLTKDRVIYSFFSTSMSRGMTDVLTFDLKTSKWGTLSLTGYVMKPRKRFITANFIWNGNETIAVYGGFTNFGYDANLYL